MPGRTPHTVDKHGRDGAVGNENVERRGRPEHTRRLGRRLSPALLKYAGVKSSRSCKLKRRAKPRGGKPWTVPA